MLHKRPWVYVCSPTTAHGPRFSPMRPVEWVQRLARLLYNEGLWPVAPHLYTAQFLDDRVLEERDTARIWGMSLVERCQRVYAFSPDSLHTGRMKIELRWAQLLGLPIFWLDLVTLDYWVS